MALGQIGLEQRVRLGAEAGVLEQVGGGGDHRLALVAVGDLAVGARRLLAHVGEQRGRQDDRRRRLRARLAGVGLDDVDARQVDLRDQRLHAVGARKRRVGLEPLQRGIEGGDERARARPSPSRSSRGRSRRRSWSPCRSARACAPASPSRARTAARVAASTFTGFFASAATSAFRRKPHRDIGRVLRRRVGEREQRRRQAILGDHLLVVGVPRIEGEQAPVVGASATPAWRARRRAPR